MIEDSYHSLRPRPEPQPPLVRGRSVDYFVLSTIEQAAVETYLAGRCSLIAVPPRAQVFLQRHERTVIAARAQAAS